MSLSHFSYNTKDNIGNPVSSGISTLTASLDQIKINITKLKLHHDNLIEQKEAQKDTLQRIENIWNWLMSFWEKKNRLLDCIQREVYWESAVLAIELANDQLEKTNMNQELAELQSSINSEDIEQKIAIVLAELDQLIQKESEQEKRIQFILENSDAIKDVVPFLRNHILLQTDWVLQNSQSSIIFSNSPNTIVWPSAFKSEKAVSEKFVIANVTWPEEAKQVHQVELLALESIFSLKTDLATEEKWDNWPEEQIFPKVITDEPIVQAENWIISDILPEQKSTRVKNLVMPEAWKKIDWKMLISLDQELQYYSNLTKRLEELENELTLEQTKLERANSEKDVIKNKEWSLSKCNERASKNKIWRDILQKLGNTSIALESKREKIKKISEKIKQIKKEIAEIKEKNPKKEYGEFFDVLSVELNKAWLNKDWKDVYTQLATTTDISSLIMPEEIWEYYEEIPENDWLSDLLINYPGVDILNFSSPESWLALIYYKIEWKEYYDYCNDYWILQLSWKKSSWEPWYYKATSFFGNYSLVQKEKDGIWYILDLNFSIIAEYSPEEVKYVWSGEIYILRGNTHHKILIANPAEQILCIEEEIWKIPHQRSKMPEITRIDWDVALTKEQIQLRRAYMQKWENQKMILSRGLTEMEREKLLQNLNMIIQAIGSSILATNTVFGSFGNQIHEHFKKCNNDIPVCLPESIYWQSIDAAQEKMLDWVDQKLGHNSSLKYYPENPKDADWHLQGTSIEKGRYLNKILSQCPASSKDIILNHAFIETILIELLTAIFNQQIKKSDMSLSVYRTSFLDDLSGTDCIIDMESEIHAIDFTFSPRKNFEKTATCPDFQVCKRWAIRPQERNTPVRCETLYINWHEDFIRAYIEWYIKQIITGGTDKDGDILSSISGLPWYNKLMRKIQSSHTFNVLMEALQKFFAWDLKQA